MNKNNNKLYRFISILCILCFLSPAILAETQKQIQPGETPQGLTTNEWGSIQQQINSAKYRAHPDNKGGYRASNPAQGWQIEYAADGTTTLTPRNTKAKPYHLRMKLSAIGYQNLQPLHNPQKISQQDFTVSYQWNDTLRERWINSEQQLEQWFDIARRPEGADKGVPLTVQMTLNSELKISQNGNNIQFTNPQGTDITYDKLKVWDSTGRELSSRMQLAGNTLNLLVDDSTARYPLTIDPSFKQQAFIKASNDNFEVDPEDASFGHSVAISGDTLVVGAPNESGVRDGLPGFIDNAGAAYVFIHNGSNWIQQAYLKTTAVLEDSFFGVAVAISGDTVVVGGPAGIHVFTRQDLVWSQQTILQPQGNRNNYLYFTSIAIDGDTLVAGEFDLNEVYVFIRNKESWSQQAYLKASNTGINDGFGKSVDISGDTVVVGARFEDSNSVGINGDQDDDSAADSGAAYVFIRRGGTWSQQAYLKASNTDAGDLFGRSVAIFGDTLAVGAVREDSNSTGVNGEGSNNLATSSGAVYVYTRSEETWSQQAYLKASNTGVNDIFGASVAISSDTLVVGAFEEESRSRGVNGDQSDNSTLSAGAAFVFTRSNSTWTQQAYLKASNTGRYDWFGYAVTISGDTLAVSSPREGEESTRPGVNGDQSYNLGVGSGAVYVFDMKDVRPNVETLSIPIQTASDDAEENLNDGDVSLFSSDLELTQDKLKPQVVGLRFPLNIPAGATILNATIQFTADETSSAPTDLVVSAEATPHALTFADLDSDISNRLLTATSIAWTPLAWSLKGEAGPNQQTPDLSSLVQEIVDYGDWGPGNSIAFIISGNGTREAESFDGTAAPVLHVTFSTEQPVTYTIGDTGPGGGIVFHTTNEGLNGLEVAPANQGQAVWGCFARTKPPAIITGANGVEVGSGAQNTADILAACSEPGIAAEIADLYQLDGVSDWFLPSANEALLMYEQRVLLALNANFWTSTENSAYSSFYLRLSQGDTRTGNKEKFFDVWPIRAF